MRVLVTGAAGFTGGHLAAALRDDPQVELHLAARSAPAGAPMEACDLADPGAVLALLERVRPREVYHLAGSFTNECEADHRANVATTEAVLEGVRRLGLVARVLLVGSAAEYGRVAPGESPIGEEHPLRPASVYGLTKVCQTRLMAFYGAAHGLDVVMARTFNLHGPGVSSRLFAGRIYAWVAERRADGARPPLRLGNLDRRRDYLEVSTAVACYRRIMRHGRPGEVYNVGSGRPTRNRDFAAQVLRAHGIDPARIEDGAAEDAVGSDIESIYADTRRLESLPGLGGELHQ